MDSGYPRPVSPEPWRPQTFPETRQEVRDLAPVYGVPRSVIDETRSRWPTEFHPTTPPDIKMPTYGQRHGY